MEVYEKNHLIGSESFTASIGPSYKHILVGINNDPKIKGNFKIVIRSDVPEFEKADNVIKIDLGSIKFNDGNLTLRQHGDIRTINGSSV